MAEIEIDVRALEEGQQETQSEYLEMEGRLNSRILEEGELWRQTARVLRDDLAGLAEVAGGMETALEGLEDGRGLTVALLLYQ